MAPAMDDHIADAVLLPPRLWLRPGLAAGCKRTRPRSGRLTVALIFHCALFCF